jgi:hypothetical protein
MLMIATVKSRIYPFDFGPISRSFRAELLKRFDGLIWNNEYSVTFSLDRSFTAGNWIANLIEPDSSGFPNALAIAFCEAR